MIAPQKKRLLHIVGYAVRGGCERCCEVFIRHCPEFQHEVLVMGTTGPMSAVWEELGATVTHLDVLRLGWLAFQAAIKAAVRRTTFEGTILWAGIRAPLVLAALSGARRPVALHAGNPFAGSARIRWLLRAGQLLPRPDNAVVISCSVHVARTFRRAPYFRRLPVESCLNPIEAPFENPHQPRAVTPADRVRLGMVARLDPIKDHRALLQVFKELRPAWPKAELHLAGDGPLRESLEAMAVALGIREAVQFHGSIGDVPAFLGTLDLFVYCTTPQEGMGNAVGEALAHGLPSVVSNLEMMHEVGGEGGESAVRFAPPDPVAAAQLLDGLLRDLPARRELSVRAHRRASGWFSPRRVVERYLALLEVLA